MEFPTYFCWKWLKRYHNYLFKQISIGYMIESNLTSSFKKHKQMSRLMSANLTKAYMWNQTVQHCCRLFMDLTLWSILFSPAVEWIDAGPFSSSITFGRNGTMNNTHAHKHTQVHKNTTNLPQMYRNAEIVICREGCMHTRDRDMFFFWI